MGMEPLILVINPGSTSKKYALFKNGVLIADVRIESVSKNHYLAVLKIAHRRHEVSLTSAVFSKATTWLIEQLVHFKALKQVSDITAVGLRVVAPGELFAKHQRITEALLEEMQSKREEAPLHLTPALHELHLLNIKYPHLPVYAISDSAFHQTMPDIAKYYGINYDDAQKWEIRKFGYHGISVNSILRQLGQMCQNFPEKVIVCHLGGGASLTAIKSGISVDTSMGLTPLEGLLMSTRGGDLDDGALIHLAQKSGMNYKALETYLNNNCGLLGISGKTGDIRELLKLEAEGDLRAHLALEMFIYRIKKYIGSYLAVLDGLDVLVFSASIGERSGIMRQRICQNLSALGFRLDDAKNFAKKSSARWIHQDHAPVGIAVIPTDEMGEMYNQVEELLHQ